MQKPLDPSLFTWPSDSPQLLGATCGECATVVFPEPSRCPRCGSSSIDGTPLPRRGTLVTWTTQEFPPTVPYAGDPTGERFKPFGVGLIQLGDLVRVESRLTTCAVDELEFGMEMQLEIVPFYVDAEGDEILTFAFSPA